MPESTRRGRRALAAPLAAALLTLPTACGGHDAGSGAADGDGGGLAVAADTTTCLKDATRVTSTPAGYPTAFPLPKGTVVFHIEDRGQEGVIATGITATPFAHVLAAMNATKQAGFRVTTGETEEDDAEANWTGHGFVGRWAIRKSGTCPGQTVVQLLSRRTG